MIATLSPETSALVAAFNRAGAFQSVQWTSTVKPAAAHKGSTLVKTTTAVVRTGVDYANLGVNADTETGELPWGEWAVFPYVVQHNGQEYVRLYVKDGTVKTRYAVDGVTVDREEFLSYLTPSQRKPSKPNGGTITVKAQSVTLL